MKNNVPVHPFKDGKQNSLGETRFHDKRYSQVKCNLEKSKVVLCCVYVEQEDETAYLTYV